MKALSCWDVPRSSKTFDLWKLLIGSLLPTGDICHVTWFAMQVFVLVFCCGVLHSF